MLKLPVAALPLLAACAMAPPPAPPTEPGAICRNEGLGRFVGQPASSALGAQMLAASGARIVRWVPHGGVITMDFSPSRLTVRLDSQNRVESATCG